MNLENELRRSEIALILCLNPSVSVAEAKKALKYRDELLSKLNDSLESKDTELLVGYPKRPKKNYYALLICIIIALIALLIIDYINDMPDPAREKHIKSKYKSVGYPW